MNVGQVLLWGFASTVVLTTVMVSSRSLHLTRMDIPFLLGTIVTNDRRKANWIGFLAHMSFGWMFAFIYAAAMENAGIFTWWFGALIGAVHGLFVLTAGMGLVSNLHPRMATEQRGPEPTRMLEPPGFMILNYGRRTPLIALMSHILYGAILGFFYGS